ncbi:MAG: hypothetical protein JWO38_2420 [Gemmataceae bacterium]|nr:hypothetical protein [Gemmataceae bacterium]
MGLADDIRTLRDRALAELVAVHDYFFHTEIAWILVRQAASSNPGQGFHNLVTGTTTTAQGLAILSGDYATRHITEATFQQFLAIFEVFTGDLLRLWLTAFPRSIGGKTVKLDDALDAGDLPTLIDQLIDHELAEVTYKSPRKVFEYLERRIGLAVPPAAEIDQLAEAKASRDVLAHSRGVADAAYQTRAGSLARYPAGQPIDIPKPYHRAVWELLCKLVSDVSVAAVAKTS